MRLMILAVLASTMASTGSAQDTESKLSGSALIDHWIRAKWKDLDLKPAKRADDAEFMRRAYLDIVGRTPSLEEAEQFLLKDKSSDKRARLADRLVKDPRYSEHWAQVWTGILLGYDNNRRAGQAIGQTEAELKEMISRNVPYDEFARRVITVTGSYGGDEAGMQEATGLISYMVKIQRANQREFPQALAGKLTRVFMGVQIQCAQCHDHPFDRWTQEEFYGMASFFGEVQVRQEAVGGDKQKRMYIVEDRARRGGGRGKLGGGGDLKMPDGKGGPIKASFIGTGKGAVDGEKRRETYAKYVTEPENLQFARMGVNRAWAHFFGEGIVSPVDDFNGRNKPTNPELLDALAQDFIDHKYDTAWLMKTIAGSEAYNLSSRAKERDPRAEKYVALARVRPTSPEQIMNSVLEATGLDEVARGFAQKAVGQFRRAFEDDEGSEEAQFTGSIQSSLLMMNSELMGQGTSAIKRAVGLGPLLAKYSAPEDRVRAIFLSTVSRLPNERELGRWSAHARRGPANAGYEDLMWTLLNTSEFLFNH